MKYSNAIGAALNGLFRSTIAQPKQNGVLDGLKIAQGESTINQNNASIAKSNAEATRLNDERLLYSDDGLRNAISSALTSGNEADRTNALLRITPLVKNPEQVTDAIGKSFRQLYAQNVMNGLPNAAENLNTLNAAEKGNMYTDVKSPVMLVVPDSSYRDSVKVLCKSTGACLGSSSTSSGVGTYCGTTGGSGCSQISASIGPGGT